MSNDANKLRQRQEIRKYLVFAGMFLLFVGCMWLIFAPSKEERQREERNAGFNSELPDPRGAGIEADKIAAYEQADMKRRQEEKMRTLEDFSALADENRQNETRSPVVEIPQERESESASSYRGSGNRRNGAISSSTSAYNDINATLGSFYEAPREDPEKEALKAEVEQLKQAAAVQQPAQMTYEEQVALLEKSYELAAKYTPGKDLCIRDRARMAQVRKNGKKPNLPPTAGRQEPFPWDRSPHRWCHRFRNPSVILYCWHGWHRPDMLDSIPPWERRLTGIRGIPSVPACMVTRP